MGDATDEDDYFDTISVSSTRSKRKLNNNDYIALSRHTLYYSVPDLGGNSMEMEELQGNSHKVSGNKNIRTYSQWRDRVLENSQNYHILHENLILLLRNTILTLFRHCYWVMGIYRLSNYLLFNCGSKGIDLQRHFNNYS